MATTTTPNPRASLLAGLRTGGVRSASQPHQVPHTAAPGGSFNVPRFASASNHPSTFPEEEEDDQLADMATHNLSLNGNNFNGRQAVPMTASAADGSFNKFQYQQQQHQQLLLRQLAAQRGNPYGDAEMQAQMMQMEMLKYQAFQQAQQAQQYQAELIAQAQRQQQQQQAVRGNLRRTGAEPMTAGPTTTSFDLRSTAAAQLRARAQQAEFRANLPTGDEIGPVPMTAAIGGKFATRTLNPNANSFVASRFSENDEDVNGLTSPSTPSRTTVISGGISLGTPTTASVFNAPAPSKSDAAVSWRRGSSTAINSGLRGASVTPPMATKANWISPSNDETLSPAGKSRPQPLRFSAAASASLPSVAIDTGNVDEDASSTSSKGSPTSTSTPSTPPSAHSSLSGEYKKLYEGLGMGRPAMASITNGTIGTMRHASLPSRQPKGPPSGADELGLRNFATRLRRKAVSGLGTLVTARERRDMAIEVQAY